MRWRACTRRQLTLYILEIVRKIRLYHIVCCNNLIRIDTLLKYWVTKIAIVISAVIINKFGRTLPLKQNLYELIGNQLCVFWYLIEVQSETSRKLPGQSYFAMKINSLYPMAHCSVRHWTFPLVNLGTAYQPLTLFLLSKQKTYCKSPPPPPIIFLGNLMEKYNFVSEMNLNCRLPRKAMSV